MRASVFSFCLRNPTEMFQALVDTPIRPKNEKTLQKYLIRHTQDINPLTTGNANFGSILFLNPQAVGMAVAQDPKCHQGEIQVSSFSLVFLV